MATHRLKILPKHFDDVISGNKKAEIRFNDRNYQVGDDLILNEWDGEKYTGNVHYCRIAHILDDEIYLQKGYVMLSIEQLPF